MGYDKYGNKKVTLDGIKFDSTKEANRYCELKLLQRSGAISNLELQKKFVLIPAQYDVNNELIEKSCTYKADFYYYDNEKKCFICEDVKGYKKSKAYDLFVIKRKLMLYMHGVRIVEL